MDKKKIVFLAPTEGRGAVFGQMLKRELCMRGFELSGENAELMLISSEGLTSEDVSQYIETAQRNELPTVICGPLYETAEARTAVHFERPFLMSALFEKLDVMLEGNPQDEEQKRGRLFIDKVNRRVFYDRTMVDLIGKEYELLEYLYLNRGRAVSRKEALENVWKYGYTGHTNVVDVYIRYIRKKLDERVEKRIIHTVRGDTAGGGGYMIKGD